MWQNLFSAIGKGAKKGVGAIGGLVNEGADDEELMTTPPFTPSSTFPRDTATTTAVRRPLALPPPPTPPMAPSGAMDPGMDLSGEGVSIPALPGRSGGPQPYSPMARAKYEHVMKGADSPAGGFRRSFKDIALNAVAGLARGGVGGALTAGVGTAIDPMAGREFQFEELYRPGIERDEERARTSRRQRIEDAIFQAKADAIPREAEMDQARLEQVKVGNQVAIQNAERQRALTNSQIELNRARAQAAATGRPQKTDRVNPQTGEIETVMVYPNGDEWIVGGSANAALQGKKIASQEKIAQQSNETKLKAVDKQQAGANSRTATAQAGADRRQTERLATQGQRGGGQSKLRKPTSGGGATPEQVQQIISEAKKRGQAVSEEQVRARLKARGQ